MKEKVLLKDVLKWLKQAMKEAERDPGDTGDTITALSYRKLKVDTAIETGGVASLFVRTHNTEFRGGEWRTHRAVTKDGVIVLWEEELGVPTGAEWLPWEFIDWMRGKPW